MVDKKDGRKSVMARAFKWGFGIYDAYASSQESEIRQRTNSGPNSSDSSAEHV